MFQPPPLNTSDRKSPSKNFRSSRAGAGRSYVSTKDDHQDSVNGNANPHIAAGTRYVNSNDMSNKAAAFQSGRLPKDFADRVQIGSETLHNSRSKFGDGRPSTSNERDRENGHEAEAIRTPSDEMDVDSPAPLDTSSTESSGSAYHVTVEEEQSPTSPQPSSDQQTHGRSSNTNGFNLDDISQTAPFAPSNTGLKDLNDLSANLPFPSRPSDNLEALHRTQSATLRELQLPRPPKVPYCPRDSDIDQHSWGTYGDAMTVYMNAWNKFNAAMIEHFRARQENVTHGMYRNWVCAHGDGATAEDFEARRGSDLAGFQTYMTWLDDDRKCRMWWDVAFEEHRACMVELGRVRHRVKEMNSARGGPAQPSFAA